VHSSIYKLGKEWVSGRYVASRSAPVLLWVNTDILLDDPYWYRSLSFIVGKSRLNIAEGAILQMLGYCFLAPAPPFPVLLLGQVVVGVGEAFQNIHANAFVAAFGSGTKLGLLHGIYGKSPHPASVTTDE